ncbi:MAG: alpha/beta hydrolase [Actinobacteria bacterium]|nr:alpha/beta hydrolase [Actinomycetota bacterium]
MKNVVHARGDLPAMLIMFFFLALGLWQFLVAWKKLNGISLTGCPDRKYWTIAAGLLMIVISGSWYFSEPSHFAAPDVEGVETLVLLTLGILAATIAQFFLSFIFRITGISFARKKRVGLPVPEAGGTETVYVETDGLRVPALLMNPCETGDINVPVMLIHEYGGSREDLRGLATFLSSEGHASIAFDIDGHGMNPRGLSSPFMEITVEAMAETLVERTGSNEIVVVGVGMGGIAAVKCAGDREEVLHAVAVDPTAIAADGSCAVNALRELNILDVLVSAFKPPARHEPGTRVSLSKLIGGMKVPENIASGNVTVLSTAGTWLNSPESSTAAASKFHLGKPVFIEGSHYSLPGERSTRELILDIIRG